MLGAGVVLLLSASQAMAQVTLPANALTNSVPQGSPIPRVLPRTPPGVGPGLAAPAPAPAPSLTGGTPVNVTSVEIRGSTIYQPPHFAEATDPLRGSVDPGRIEAARQAILQAYRTEGYVFTAVAAAIPRPGELVFTVTEGHIADVKLDGDIGPAGIQVLRFLNHLTEAKPIDSDTLERWLLLAQDVPGVTLRTVLRPSQGEPGALTLVAQVSRSAWSGLATADNSAYKYTGPEQGLLSIDANSFTEFGERTTVTLYQSARSTQIFGQAASEFYIGGSGLKGRVYTGYGTTDPTGPLRQLGYHGETGLFGASVQYPVVRQRQQTLNVTGYMDFLNSSISTGFGDTTATASNDNLRVLRLGADYATQDVLFGTSRSAVSVAGLRVSQGLNGLGASMQGSRLAARVNENIGFTKVAGEITRTQTLFSPWNDATVAVQGSATAQYSGDVLPPAEKLYLGGLRWNRGYYSGQVTGDSGISVAGELQLNTNFSFNAFDTPIDIGSQFYTFYDWGETWESQKTDANRRLIDLGSGIRLFFPRSIEVDMLGVARVTRQPQGANVARLPPSGFYWRFLARF